MRCETLIIGGGLSGLALAEALSKAGRSFHLVEARDRLGGRIYSPPSTTSSFDLGPTWFWPGQTRMAAFVQRFGLEWFEQHTVGDLLFEDQSGQIHRGPSFGTTPASYRLAGGMASLIKALAADLDPSAVSLSSRVTGLRNVSKGIIAETNSGKSFEANRVVLALPPRLASLLAFTPALPDEACAAMRAIPTWMAAQAKVITVYQRPFWRDAGLSGHAMSRQGPLVELHDASADNQHALFGFVGLPAPARQDKDQLEELCLAQLTRLFGPDAQNPVAIHVKDWAQDALTATPLDLQPLYEHPRYGLSPSLKHLWEGRLILSGTETAPQFGGYLEGALEAAESTVAGLTGVDCLFWRCGIQRFDIEQRFSFALPHFPVTDYGDDPNAFCCFSSDRLAVIVSSGNGLRQGWVKFIGGCPIA